MKIWIAYAIVATWSNAPVQADMHALPIQRVTYGWDFRGWDSLMSKDASFAEQEPLVAPELGRGQANIPTTASTGSQNKIRHAIRQVSLLDRVGFSTTVDAEILWTSMYMTTIGIGSPPIPLRAQVDTSWGPLFVASTDCVSEPCQGDRGHLYNPNNSSTSRGNLGASQVTYPDQFYGVDTWGNETRDTVHVGNLQMDNQLFESVTKWKTFPTGPDRFFDTVIGLALRDIKADDTTMPTTSLFQSMINSRSLDHRLFTLRLSRTDEDPGELVLGGIPDYIDKDELVDIPLTSNYDGGEGRGMRYLASNGGQVALNNITISSGGNSTHQPLLTRGYTAVLSTSYPWIVFPWKETEAIWEQLGFEGGQVPCEARAQLPNITFAFGPDEKKITLTPWDYVLEVYADVYGRLDCTIMIGGMNEFDSNGFVLLGSPFLNGLYSVWDAGNNTMSFANRPR